MPSEEPSEADVDRSENGDAVMTVASDTAAYLGKRAADEGLSADGILVAASEVEELVDGQLDREADR